MAFPGLFQITFVFYACGVCYSITFVIVNYLINVYPSLDQSTPRTPAKRPRIQLSFLSPIQENSNSNLEQVEISQEQESATIVGSTLNESFHNMQLTSLNKSYSTYAGDPLNESNSDCSFHTESESD